MGHKIVKVYRLDKTGRMKGYNTGMDRQFSWKRTDDIEIDLADLLKRLCWQWRWIAVCALASAVILGVYGLQKDRSDPVSVEVSDKANEGELSETEEQAVQSAVLLEREIRGLETYLDSSVLMHLDPYHKNRVVMLFCIENAKRQQMQKITEAYLNFVTNGGAADAMTKSCGWKMDKSCMAEVISAYQKTYSPPYQVIVDEMFDSGMMPYQLFYVEVTGSDEQAAEKMAGDMQSVLENYSVRVKKEIGSHALTLVNCMKNTTIDSSLQSQQHDKKTLLSSSKANLKTMTDAFNKQQMTAYKKAVGMEDEDVKDQAEEFLTESKTDFGIKYALLGALGGVFVFCSLFICGYLFRDTVKSAEELKRLYTFPFLGAVTLNEKGSMAKRTHDVEQEKAWMLKRIKFACKKHGIEKLCAVSGNLYHLREKDCLENIAGQLKDCGIHMTIAENAGMDIEVLDRLAETGNVLIVCRTGKTTHQMIDDAMDFYMENDITVIGVIAFS